MTSLYEQFSTDTEREVKGIVLDFGEAGEITVARAGGANKRYAKVLKQKAAPYKRQMEHDLMTMEQADDLLVDVFVEAVVIGWKRIKDREGNDIKFSKKACADLFKDLPEFFATVREEANKAANFRNDDLEADTKNS